MEQGSVRRRLVRTGLLTVTVAYALASPAGSFVLGADGSVSTREQVWKRSDQDDDGLDLLPDLDGADADDDGILLTVTSNADRDDTRGDDGTNGAKTVTANLDGDDTRGDDGTSAGDGGTITANLDGDDTRGDDGTNGAKTVTVNGDGDDTRGDDGTSDGDLTAGEDGTDHGDDTELLDDARA